MKNTIKLALVAAMAMGATSAFATNGDNLIGLGAKSRAMGGTGIAHFNGSESATSNPALITKAKGSNISFGGTYFSPDVTVKTTGTPAPPLGAGQNPVSATSDAKHNVIPYVALTENLGNGFVVGASMFGSAGMGTDWRDSGANTVLTDGQFGLYSMRSNLLLLKFSVPVAYGQDNWSVGIAPVLMYGALDMSFDSSAGADVGNGSSSDFGFGYELGAAYELPDLGLTIAAMYHSSISMTYDDQVATTGAAFGFVGAPGGAAAFSDTLEQPAEIGIGVDWTEGDLSVTADIKQIQWEDAEGYGEFGWEDQTVYALGAEYRMDDLAIRVGYNYAKNPIKENTTATSTITGATLSPTYNPATDGPLVGDAINALNHVMFPAITESHYTLGLGYQFTKNVGADFALTYATSPDVSVAANTVGLGTITTTNDQFAFSGNLNYSF